MYRRLAFREGNFSSLATPVIHPLTKQQFPGNIIPASRLSASALALQKYYPNPNQSGATNYTGRTRNDIDNDQFLIRIDQIFGVEDRLYGSFIRQTNEIRTLAILPSDVRAEPNTDWSLALNETHIFGPNVINEFRLGYTRLKFANTNNFTAGLPAINITGLLGLSSYGPLFQIDETAQRVNNLSIITGRHTIKMGYDGRKGRIARRGSNWPRGDINITAEMTGSSYADFLLGLPRRSNGVENLNYAKPGGSL